jgi:hypothetical protein
MRLIGAVTGDPGDCYKETDGNPAGGPVGSRHRQQLNGEFIATLLRDFRHGGPKAIERVRRTQPAAYLKILALLMPCEQKVEHRNLIKELTDEELEAKPASTAATDIETRP